MPQTHRHTHTHREVGAEVKALLYLAVDFVGKALQGLVGSLVLLKRGLHIPSFKVVV